MAQESPGGTNRSDYYGNYRLEPGRILTGGPFEEGRLLLMEVMNLSAGALFEPRGKDEFVSVFPTGIEVSFIRKDGEVSGLLWKEPGVPEARAPRVYPHSKEDIFFESGDVTLAGSLFVPQMPGPHPALVHVHGSGDQDRHGGPWITFFLQLGMAVLSYDKRGVGQSTGSWRAGSYEALASDAAAAVEYLTSRPEIKASQIGIHGSSEGGWVAPIAAARAENVAFLIIRAGPAQPPVKTVLHERKNEFLAMDLTEEERRQAMQLWRRIFEAAARGEAWESLDSITAPVRDTDWYQKIYSSGRPFQDRQMWSWTVKNAHVDPAEWVRKLDIPILWFLAERDENVDTAASASRLREAFEQAPTKDHELKILPDANHAFFVTTPGGGRKYSPGYWDTMARWLRERGLARREP